MSKHALAFIVGPTATGKSQLAMEAAELCAGAIVNGDSVQVYRGLDIGAAKPSPQDFAAVTHYLYDIVEAGLSYTAGDYRRDALELIAAKLPQQPLLFVGGSGFYFQALEHGMYDVGVIPSAVAEHYHEKIREQGLPEAYKELQQKDPASAQEVSEQDSYRIHRALCVVEGTGRKLSEIKKEFATSKTNLGDQHRLLKVGLRMDRETLRARVVKRVQKMLEQGWVEETRALLEAHGDWSPLKSVGYFEVAQFLRGEFAQTELVERVTNSTMKLAKRQRTWFQRDSEIQWFDSESEWSQARDCLVGHLKEG